MKINRTAERLRKAERDVWSGHTGTQHRCGRETPSCLLHPLRYISFVPYRPTVPLAHTGPYLFLGTYEDTLSSMLVCTHIYLLADIGRRGCCTTYCLHDQGPAASASYFLKPTTTSWGLDRVVGYKLRSPE